MKTSPLTAALLSVGLACGSMSAAAHPDYRWRGGPEPPHWDAARSYDGRWRHERPLRREDYVYRSGDGRYYCRRSDGTTGLVVGGLAGAALGEAIGGETVAALLGAAGGAALGKSIDSDKIHCG